MAPHPITAASRGSGCIGLVRHSPNPGNYRAILRPIETRCNEIWLATDCARSQIVGLAASKRGNSSLVLYYDIPLPSSLVILLSSAFMPARVTLTVGRD